MPIPTIPQIVEANFGEALRCSAKEILAMCRQKLNATQMPAHLVAHIAAPSDFDTTKTLCIYITHVLNTGHHPAGYSFSEEDIRPSDLADKLLLCAIPITVNAKDDIRLAGQDEPGLPATEALISAECIAQAESAWLCMHTLAAWTPRLRLETIEAAWVARWALH